MNAFVFWVALRSVFGGVRRERKKTPNKHLLAKIAKNTIDQQILKKNRFKVKGLRSVGFLGFQGLGSRI